MAFLLIASWAASAPSGCQGRACGAQVAPGASISLVAHSERARDRPWADDARAWLCDACIGRLGDRLERPAPRPSAPLPPFLWRGKPVPAW